MTRPRWAHRLLQVLSADMPLRDLVWRQMLVIGSLINVACSFTALVLLAAGAHAGWAVLVHFAPLPWNAALLAAVWRHPRTTPLWSWLAVGWFAGMLLV